MMTKPMITDACNFWAFQLASLLMHAQGCKSETRCTEHWQSSVCWVNNFGTATFKSVKKWLRFKGFLMFSACTHHARLEGVRLKPELIENSDGQEFRIQCLKATMTLLNSMDPFSHASHIARWESFCFDQVTLGATWRMAESAGRLSRSASRITRLDQQRSFLLSRGIYNKFCGNSVGVGGPKIALWESHQVFAQRMSTVMSLWPSSEGSPRQLQLYPMLRLWHEVGQSTS